MEIVWCKLHEILSLSKKKVSKCFGIFLSVKSLVHTKLVIGRLPSFIFPGGFDSMASVARQKLAVNMVDSINNCLDTLWENRPLAFIIQVKNNINFSTYLRHLIVHTHYMKSFNML